MSRRAPVHGREDGWRARTRGAGQLWLVNVGLAALVTSLYLVHAPPPRSFAMGLFLSLGLVASAALASVPAGIVTTALGTVPNATVRAAGAAAAWTLTHTLLFVDVQIYGLFRFHFNAMVWNVLTTAGADEAVHISPRELALVLAGVAVLFVAELALFRVLARREARRRREGRRAPFLLRPGAVWGLVLLPAVVAVAADFAWANLVRNRQVTALSRLYPLVPRITVKGLASRFLGFDPEERPRVEVATEGILLDYPHAPPAIDPAGPRPNLVLVVIDSLRADMLAPETTPRLWSLVPESAVFRDHLSGGNGTRFGLFSLLYGLHGSYWGPVYDEQRSPVLIDTLLHLGYSMRILTSASMSYPEFRSTAFVRIEDAVEDRLRAPQSIRREGGRDDGIPLRFRAWLARPGIAEGPFFALLLLDAPHQSYDFPVEFEHFRPSADDLSYLALARATAPEEITPVFNRYRNAVRYADHVTGRILDALDEAGVADETVVLITGDHGEEFLEHGRFGHASDYTRTQLHVPLLLRGPGIPPGEILAPTSHIDVPPTLLELLGADPAARSAWTLGENLFAAPPHRRRVGAGWSDLALVTGDAILHIPLSGHRGFGIDVLDPGWRLIEDDGALLAREADALVNLARECRRFLR